VSDSYAFIAAENADPDCAWPLIKMCAWLDVSRSGFYEYLNREPSNTTRRRERLLVLVKAIFFQESRGTYGYRRVHAAVLRAGEQASPELVRALMVSADLVACQPRPFRTTTTADPAAAAAADHLGRDFTAEAPGVKLVGDITYIPTWEGWLYLGTVIDCFSKRVVGWSMADHMRTSLVCDAIDMAAGNIELAEGCVFHSDRGSQYTSDQFHVHLDSHGITGSMGRTGVCWDNALAESFFAALKNELVHRTVFPTRRHARRAIAEYVEVFYNRQRLHSGLAYHTPTEIEQVYRKTQLAA
jgi:putative transposase